jgi:DNA-binding CsgD family transcriptional regulator
VLLFPRWGAFCTCQRRGAQRNIYTPVIRTILIYGVLLAAGAFGLQWLEYQFLVRTHATEIYLVLVALAFMGLGVWVGARLFRRPPQTPFAPNTQVRETLGVSDREFEVLALLAGGRSNKEIANQLNVSPNTVKTHVANLFGKLEAKRRTQAISRARELGMIQ